MRISRNFVLYFRTYDEITSGLGAVQIINRAPPNLSWSCLVYAIQG